MQKNVYELTNEGIQKLNEELEYLVNTARPANVEAIKDARAQGDLSENADYDAARNEQARIEGRINEIQNILKNAKVIEDSKDATKVTTGKKVTVEFVNNQLRKEYRIVGTIEANPFQGRISNESPLGKAILNKKVGASITYKSETEQDITVKIISVE